MVRRRSGDTYEYFYSDLVAPLLQFTSLLSYFSAMIVAPDVWLSLLTKQLPEDQKDNTNLTIYACLVGGSIVFCTIRSCVFLLVSLRCSERLHDKMVVAVLQAPVLFFDLNPVGRIMNRFSKDVGCMDDATKKVPHGNPDGLVGINISSRANCHKSLASVCCCSDDCNGRVHFEVLLEDVQRTEKVRVHMSQSSLLSHFRDTERTGYDSDKRETKRFRGSVLQVC